MAELDEILNQVAILQSEVYRLRSQIPDDMEFMGAGGARPQIENGDLPEDVPYYQLFDLYKVKTTSLEIRDDQADTSGAWIEGVHKSISAGAGLTAGGAGWAGDVDHLKYIYLNMDRENATVEITMGDSMSDGTDTVERIPLWYIGWDTDHIANIIDLRHAARLPAMA